MINKKIQSYVWHGDKCYFVSTVEIKTNPPGDLLPKPVNETMMWEYDYDSRQPGKDFLIQDFDVAGSIKLHLNICEQIFKGGIESLIPLPEEERRENNNQYTN